MRVGWLVGVVLVLSGCAGTGEPPSPSTDPTSTTPLHPWPTVDQAVVDHERGWRPLGEPREVTYYLAPDGSLTTTLPPEGSVPADVDITDLVNPVKSVTYHTWTGDALTEAIAIESVREATVYYRADTNMKSSAGIVSGSWDLVGWIGDERQLRKSDGAVGPAELEAESTHVANFSFFMPRGGMVLPAGSRPSFYVFSNYYQTKDHPLQFLTGGSTPTHVRLRIQPIEILYAPTNATLIDETGSLDAHQPGTDVGNGPDTLRYPVRLGWDMGMTRMIEISVAPAEGQLGHVDLDLFLEAPGVGHTLLTKGYVEYGSTHQASERIDRYPPNALSDGTYTLIVANWQPTPVKFHLEGRVYHKA